LKEGLFYLGLGALFAHELDAVANHEWRVFPGLSALSDEAGAVVFVAAHVPLFAVIVALVASQRQIIRQRTRLAIAAFLLIHAALHVFFRHHSAYDFSSVLSGFLIYGGAIAGALYLAASRHHGRDSSEGS
jgi:hypothetical protein